MKYESQNDKNSKIGVGETEKLEKGLFARLSIGKNEVLFDMEEGKKYYADSATQLPDEARDYCPQFGEYNYVCHDLMRFMNHSCDPNCGYSGKFKIVAMRDIKPGEELTFDYEMSEDSDWRMSCHCGSDICRGTIGAFANMPEDVRKKYGSYISDWLKEKYNL